MKWLFPFAMIGVVACATTAPPPEQVVTEARAAIQEAFTAGATDVVDANHYLQMAEDHFDAAADHADKGHGDRAIRLYEQARLDARLATQLADEHRAAERERRAQEWLDRIDRAARQSSNPPERPAGDPQ